jgi:hypothetical protein
MSLAPLGELPENLWNLGKLVSHFPKVIWEEFDQKSFL